MDRVAFQGEVGAYSEQAGRQYFGEPIETVPCQDFAGVFRAVVEGDVDYGIVPIENSLAGSIHQNYDLLLANDVWIEGEYKLRVIHNLLAFPGVKITDLKRVLSHPQALSQCAGYLKTLKGVEPVSYFDTAGSARYVAENRFPDTAAIAGSRAGETYGLAVLASGIEDDHRNFTRFFVLAAKGQEASLPETAEVPFKTSIVFALRNIPGALQKSLSIFAIRDIDLFKIESRPIPGSPWQYLFYLDFEGKANDERTIRALAHLGEITTVLKVLGSYPASA